ncbi:MAG: hypothetical protein DYG89_18095 [Caldilinea sp. CFX5]|nr:hypothetical protein [Caldilinea sp. CFX5]
MWTSKRLLALLLLLVTSCEPLSAIRPASTVPNPLAVTSALPAPPSSDLAAFIGVNVVTLWRRLDKRKSLHLST